MKLPGIQYGPVQELRTVDPAVHRALGAAKMKFAQTFQGVVETAGDVYVKMATTELNTAKASLAIEDAGLQRVLKTQLYVRPEDLPEHIRNAATTQDIEQPVIDTATGEQAKDEDGQPIFEMVPMVPTHTIADEVYAWRMDEAERLAQEGMKTPLAKGTLTQDYNEQIKPTGQAKVAVASYEQQQVLDQAELAETLEKLADLGNDDALTESERAIDRAVHANIVSATEGVKLKESSRQRISYDHYLGQAESAAADQDLTRLNAISLRIADDRDMTTAQRTSLLRYIAARRSDMDDAGDSAIKAAKEKREVDDLVKLSRGEVTPGDVFENMLKGVYTSEGARRMYNKVTGTDAVKSNPETIRELEIWSANIPFSADPSSVFEETMHRATAAYSRGEITSTDYNAIRQQAEDLQTFRFDTLSYNQAEQQLNMSIIGFSDIGALMASGISYTDIQTRSRLLAVAQRTLQAHVLRGGDALTWIDANLHKYQYPSMIKQYQYENIASGHPQALQYLRKDGRPWVYDPEAKKTLWFDTTTSVAALKAAHDRGDIDQSDFIDILRTLTDPGYVRIK